MTVRSALKVSHKFSHAQVSLMAMLAFARDHGFWPEFFPFGVQY
jgi:hypothetical protein